MTTARRVIIPCLTLLFLCLNAEQSFGQITGGKWDDIMGKQILNLQGVQLAHVTDNTIDIEHARFVGVMVSFLGIYGYWGENRYCYTRCPDDRRTSQNIISGHG